MIKEITNFDSMSVEELLTVIKDNIEENAKMQAEIQKLKLEHTKDLNKKEINIKNPLNTTSLTEKDDTSLISIIEEDENKLNDYFQALQDIQKSPTMIEQIREILPFRENSDYLEIIKGLKLKLLREIKENSQIINYFKDDISSSELTDFRNQIALDREKIRIINIIEHEKDSKKAEEVVKNELIFTITSGGNIRILEEIDYISQEYYPSFKMLFDSIIDGSFKNLKHFNNNGNLIGVSQVKDFKTRIVFKRIGENAYAIITMFVKKSDNDKGYKLSLINRINEFKSQEKMLKELIADPEFLQENRMFKNILYNKLTQPSKNKVLIKTGDQDE